jgi:hypothetical protein
MPQTLPRNIRLEDVTPEVHAGGEKVGPQMLEELYSANDIEPK